MAGTVSLTALRAEGVIRRAWLHLTTDASDGSLPDTTLRSLGIHIDGRILAISVKTDDDYTAGWDIVLNDSFGIDRLHGAGSNLAADAAVMNAVTGPGYVGSDEELTLEFSGHTGTSDEADMMLFWAGA